MFQLVIPKDCIMNPFHMMSEIVLPVPFLVLLSAILKLAHEVFATETMVFRVAASLVAIEIVHCAKAFGT